MVDMLRAGCFQSLLDVQCFDLQAVESLRTDPRHQEISALHYASPTMRSAVVDSLDVVILGATEISTPGRDIDVLVTQGGIAVNPKNGALAQRLRDAGLPVLDIHELKAKAEAITGTPKALPKGDRVVAEVISRDGETLDRICAVPEL